MSDFFAVPSAAGQATAGQAATAATPVTTAPPGWYADPYTPGLLRWFDGQTWTEHATGYPGAGYGGWGGPPVRDRSMEMLMPVNRTALSIVAGYAGLFSILLVFAPIALLLGVLALMDLSHKPDVGGRGRSWFAVVAGALGTVGLFAVIAH